MHISSSKLSGTSRQLTVSLTSEELVPIKQQVLKELGRSVKVPGFRAGKVPENLIEKNLDQSVLQSEFLERAVNVSYSQAIQKEAIRPVAAPAISIKKFVPYDTLDYEATIDVVGEIVLPDYHKISLKAPEVVVEDKEVDDVIASLQRRMAEKSSVDRAAKDGDEVIIDFDGTDEKGTAVNGASAKDYPLMLGSNTFIPGFEPEIVGLKAGDSKTFKVTFPSDYQVKALAKKKVTFSVTVHTVNELSVPALDDDFAAKAGPFKSLKDLKADVKKELAYEAAQRARRQFENEIMAAIAAKAKVELPKSLVDEQIQQMEAEERRNLAYRGQTWAEHLAEEGVTEEVHAERQRPRAEEIITGSLLLTEIAAKEGLEVTEDELEVRLTILKGQYTDKAMRAELDKPENKRETEGRMMAEKTLDRLVEIVTAKKK